jgi:DNA recombination protein RmuC
MGMTPFTEGFIAGLTVGGLVAAVFAIVALVQWRRATVLAAASAAGEDWKPLRARLVDFENLVRDTYEREGRERFHLEKEIEALANETNLLSTSLRGDSKVQGDWGEVLLEKILESSGLRSGEEFEVQASFTDDEGRVQRPDVVVRLPGDRSVIIDAKVSMTAWDRYSRATSDEQREVELEAHVQSLRRHIQTLGAKRYHAIKDSSSPEFVFLFTRIEPAWIEALRWDKTLVEFAAANGVAVVSPSTLFAALKTVSGLWSRERQNKNALKIADEAGKLYDKFVQFSGDLSEVSRDLEKATERLSQAKRKLTEGPGNLAGRAEKIRELGAKSSKKLSDVLREELQSLE